MFRLWFLKRESELFFFFFFFFFFGVYLKAESSNKNRIRMQAKPNLICLIHAYQSLACKTAINTDFNELFSLKRIYVKYKNAILSLIDSFFRIWKDKTYGQVLSQIFN